MSKISEMRLKYQRINQCSFFSYLTNILKATTMPNLLYFFGRVPGLVLKSGTSALPPYFLVKKGNQNECFQISHRTTPSLSFFLVRILFQVRFSRGKICIEKGVAIRGRVLSAQQAKHGITSFFSLVKFIFHFVKDSYENPTISSMVNVSGSSGASEEEKSFIQSSSRNSVR